MDAVELRYSVSRENRVELSAQLLLADGRRDDWGTYPLDVRHQDLCARSAEVRDALSDAREVMGECQSDDDLEAARGHVEALAELGRALRRLLLPETALERLRAASADHILFECNPLLNGVPFDAMFLWDDFVGLRYATGKRLRAPAGLHRPPTAAGPLHLRFWFRT